MSPITVTKTANPNPVASGDQLTYTIVAVNTAGSKVTNVVMTDQVNGVGTIQSPPGLPQLTITSTMGSCTQGGPNGNVVTCSIGTVNGGASFTVTIRGQVTASNGTTLNNTATVTGTRSAQTFTTSGSVSVPVNGGTGGGSLPDLTLNKTGPTSVAPSTAFAYNLTVNNVGTANTANVKVVDTLPPDVAFVSTSTTSLFSCTPTAPTTPPAGGQVTVTCTGGAVNAGQNASITINATSPAATGTITNTAVVDPDNTIAESNELNNASATVNTSVSGPPPAPLLTIFKTDDPLAYPWSAGAGPDPVNPGQQLVYKIQVKNNATTRADDVVISDGTQGLDASGLVASQVVVNGTVGNTGGCFVNAPLVTCKVRTLNPGGTITVTISGTVIATAGTTIFNTATVNGNIKNVGVTATDSEETTVRPAVDLTITKADSPDPVCARSWPTTSNPAAQHLANPADSPAATGDIPAGGLLNAPATPPCLGGLTYTFVVGNSGIGTASNVVVRDPLPAGLIFDSYENGTPSGGFVCAVDAQNVVTCSQGTVPAADTRTITLRFVAPPDLGRITNTVTVDPNNAIFEPDETNNIASTTTNVTTGVDLVTWKSDSKNPNPPGDDTTGAPTLVPGDGLSGAGKTGLGDGFDPIATRGTETYTIYVDNVGTQDTTGIRLRDTLPTDTIFLSVVADPDHGFTCSYSSGVVECIGGHLLGTESEFYDPAGPATIVPKDDFATIKIRVFARATVGTMHNEVRVDPLNEIAEVNELNNLATDDTTVTVGNYDKGAYNQLSVVKTHLSPASGSVATNGILIYDLEVTNNATDPVSSIVLKDTLPSGTRFIEAKDTDTGTDAFFCSHDGSATGGVITCTGGDLDGTINTIPVGGTSRHVRVKVFAPNAPGTYTNLATVDPDNIVAEGNEFDNDAQLQTTVAPCTDLNDCGLKNAVYELTIVKSQNRATIARNGLETYTLLVSNLGSDPVSGIRVEDALPAGSRFFDAKDTAVPPTTPEAFTCSHDGSPTGGVVTCVGGVLDGTGDTLGAGVPTSRSIQIRAFMPDTPGTYTNRAVVDPQNTVPEGNEFNNESSIETEVKNGGPNPYIDLHVVKTQELLDDQVLNQDTNVGPTGVSLVAPGDPVFYKLVVSNLGEADAFNVVARDALPADMTYFSAFDAGAASPDQFSCGLLPGDTHTVECIAGRIPAGMSRTINIFAFAPEGLDQTAPNLGDIKKLDIDTAVVDPNNAIGEGDEANNEDFEQTIIRSKINLTLDKEGPDNASQNQEDDYVITVKNEKVWGQGDIAVDAVVIDTLPVGLIPLGVTTSAGNFLCNVLENPVNTVQCVGDLEPDQEVTITVHVFITQEDGKMYNQACIDPDHLIDETSELDNCDIKTTNVGENPPPPPPDAPNLNINKSASTSVVTPGQTFDYTVSVSNVGTGTSAAPLTITDDLSTLPVTFVSAVATNGFTCSESAGVVSCTGASGLAAGGSTNITIQVTVTNAATTAFTNTASVPDPAEADGTAEDSVTTNVGGTDVAIAVADISDSPDPVAAGAVVTYTTVVTNGGTGPANGLDITQTFVDTTGLTFVSGVGSQGFTCTWSDPTVTCSGDLPAGQSTILTTKFDTDTTTPAALQSTVFADSNLEFTETDEVDNLDFETTTVQSGLCQGCYDLVMGPIFANPDPVANNAQVTFNFDVTNVGDIPTSSDPDAGTDEVVVAIDVDTTFNEYASGTLSVNLPGFSCVLSDNAGTNSSTPEAVCTKAAGLNGGEGVIASVTVTADTAADPSFLAFDVVVDPGNLVAGEFNETNNDGGIFVTVDTPPPGP